MVRWLVNLLYIDSHYFPKLARQMDWFVKLEHALENRVLQASDLSAITLLVDCVRDGGCAVKGFIVEALLDRLIVLNPQELGLILSKYKLMLATATSAQTVFTLTNSYVPSSTNNGIAVYVQGVKQMPDTYTETDANTITFDAEQDIKQW